MTDMELLPQMGVSLVEKAESRGLPLRMLGAAAFRVHCPEFSYFHSLLSRKLSDIDFASKGEFLNDAKLFFSEMGWQNLHSVITLIGGNRVAFSSKEDPTIHTDVFLDKLEFCHDIDLRQRLLVDRHTIPLAELLLEKMQIIKINKKDIIDSVMLVREHEVGAGDNEMINTRVIAKIMANDWGFYKTFTTNLGVVAKSVDQMTEIEKGDKTDVSEKIAKIRADVEAEPRSLSWKMRARIGERKKWYRDVEELTR
jgi:hypothetical protein